ncbi:MAG: N-acetyltransferase [Chitinophagales bacterium]|nr:N-acetyltransferase [Chitinophagaceae bacterium]MCB9065742.1 N-acetyltransferase [Chitinophagales bacterium]
MVQQDNDDKRGRFYIKQDDEFIARMEYVYAGPEKFIIEHTEVDPNHEGKGLAKQLLTAAVQFARENDMKIIPLCPYTNASFHKNPDEYKDVWFGR